MFRKHKHKISHVEVLEPEKKQEIKRTHDGRLFSQTVTVNVTVNEKDDSVANCLSGCFKACFGIVKKAAT